MNRHLARKVDDRQAYHWCEWQAYHQGHPEDGQI